MSLIFFFSLLFLYIYILELFSSISCFLRVYKMSIVVHILRMWMRFSVLDEGMSSFLVWKTLNYERSIALAQIYTSPVPQCQQRANRSCFPIIICIEHLKTCCIETVPYSLFPTLRKIQQQNSSRIVKTFSFLSWFPFLFPSFHF